MTVLQTHDLKKYYGHESNVTRALDGVSLSVEEGQFVAVVGSSGNLDSRTSAHVLELLRASGARYGQTIVMITHNEAIARTADRIVPIEDGRIREADHET